VAVRELRLSSLTHIELDDLQPMPGAFFFLIHLEIPVVLNFFIPPF
jgi:hypothetical protein